MNPDFGRAADDYRRFRQGFPESIMERLAAFGVGSPGQRVLDMGTGTGTLARLFAGRGCSVIGLDRARELLVRAEQVDRESGTRISYVASLAEAAALRTGAFDVVTCGQCWHWFDRAVAAAEVRRLLAPDGTVVIAHFDWLPLTGNVVAATEDLILRFNPSWRLGGATGIYPAWARDLGEAGFERIETFSYDVAAHYRREAWVGRIRASAGVVALGADDLERFSSELTDLLAARFPAEPLAVPHRVWAVVARRPR